MTFHVVLYPIRCLLRQYWFPPWKHEHHDHPLILAEAKGKGTKRFGCSPPRYISHRGYGMFCIEFSSYLTELNSRSMGSSSHSEAWAVVFKGLVEQPKICTWHSQPAWAIVLLGDKKNTEKLLWECYWCWGCIVDWFGKGPLHDRSQPSSRSPQPTHRHVSGPPGALQSGRRLWNFVESDARCEVLISCL